MLRIDTLRRTCLAFVPGIALVAACGGGPTDGTSAVSADPNAPTTASTQPEGAADETAPVADEDDTVDLGDAPIAPGENTPDQPVELTEDGVPVDEAEAMPPLQAEDGTAEEEEGQNDALAETSEALEAEPAAEQPAESGEQVAANDNDGVAQRGDALGTWRGTKLANEAKRIAGFIKRSTSYYSHSTYMNEKTGTRRADCVGLVSYAIKRVLPDAFRLFGSTGPSPRTYTSYFLGRYTSASKQVSARWRRITSVKNLKPGDIVTWRNPAGSSASGHTAIVSAYPWQGRSSRGEWIVPVIDSTSSPHNYNAWDSRGSRYTGVGQGRIGLKLDSSGRPKAYYWTGGTSGTAVYRTIALGRVE